MDTCKICSEKSAAYKCPKCRIKYCSAACYKEHQNIDCQIEVNCDNNPNDEKNESFVTEDTISEDKLKLLENSEELQNILKNKHVKDILLEIDKSTDAAGIMNRAMKEPIFLEFADVCLKLLQKET